MTLTSDAFAELATVLLRDGPEAALPLADALAWGAERTPSKARVSRSLCVVIYARDNFTCRYCGRRTVLAPVLELLARVFPAQIPFESHHYPAGRTHPAFITLTASIDHVEPLAAGGAPTDPANLVTACWPCNERKADLTLEAAGMTLGPIIESDWQGLTEHYAALWRIAGQPNPSLHSSWMRAIQATSSL